MKIALFSMHPDKSSRPNGMSPGFYQKFCKIIGGDIVKLVQQFFLTGELEHWIIDTNRV